MRKHFSINKIYFSGMRISALVVETSTMIKTKNRAVSDAGESAAAFFMQSSCGYCFHRGIKPWKWRIKLGR